MSNYSSTVALASLIQRHHHIDAWTTPACSHTYIQHHFQWQRLQRTCNCTAVWMGAGLYSCCC